MQNTDRERNLLRNLVQTLEESSSPTSTQTYVDLGVELTTAQLLSSTDRAWRAITSALLDIEAAYEQLVSEARSQVGVSALASLTPTRQA